MFSLRDMLISLCAGHTIQAKQTNQCDGCRRRLVVKDGIHYDKDGNIVQCCNKHRYNKG
jgi:hypothetical protein